MIEAGAPKKASFGELRRLQLYLAAAWLMAGLIGAACPPSAVAFLVNLAKSDWTPFPLSVLIDQAKPPLARFDAGMLFAQGLALVTASIALIVYAAEWVRLLVRRPQSLLDAPAELMAYLIMVFPPLVGGAALVCGFAEPGLLGWWLVPVIGAPIILFGVKELAKMRYEIAYALQPGRAGPLTWRDAKSGLRYWISLFAGGAIVHVLRTIL